MIVFIRKSKLKINYLTALCELVGQYLSIKLLFWDIQDNKNKIKKKRNQQLIFNKTY